MKLLFKVFVMIVLLCVSSLTTAAGINDSAKQAPYTLIKSVGDQLFVDIAKLNTLDEATKRVELKKLISAQLMPHIDVKFVSYKLLGKHLRSIKREQAKTFISSVEQFLVSTYSSVLMNYKDQQVRYIKPVHDGKSNFASVRAEIVQAGAPTIDITFKFRKDKKGQWRVFDLVAEGISILDAKQKEVVARIGEVGIDAVNKELAAKS